MPSNLKTTSFNLIRKGFQRSALAMGALVVQIVLASAVPSYSQVEKLDEQRAQTQLELAVLQDQITLSQARKNELDAEISALEADRETLNRNLIDTSGRTRVLEEKIDRAAKRLE